MYLLRRKTFLTVNENDAWNYQEKSPNPLIPAKSNPKDVDFSRPLKITLQANTHVQPLAEEGYVGKGVAGEAVGC